MLESVKTLEQTVAVSQFKAVVTSVELDGSISMALLNMADKRQRSAPAQTIPGFIVLL